MDELRLKAAEKLGLENFDVYDNKLRCITGYNTNGMKEAIFRVYSDADLAEMLRVKLLEKYKHIVKAGLYSHCLYGVANKLLGNPSEDEYLKWLEWDATPLQKIEAALAALGDE